MNNLYNNLTTGK